MFTSLHLFFPFLPLLARWKTTDFSEGFSGLNICCLMLLGEHTHTDPLGDEEQSQRSREEERWLSSSPCPGFCNFPLYPVMVAVCISNPDVYFWLWSGLLQYVLVKLNSGTHLDTARRIKEKMGFKLWHFLDISGCVQLGRLWYFDPEVQHWTDQLDNLIQPSELKPRLVKPKQWLKSIKETHYITFPVIPHMYGLFFLPYSENIQSLGMLNSVMFKKAPEKSMNYHNSSQYDIW